jgi:hypothetical protein
MLTYILQQNNFIKNCTFIGVSSRHNLDLSIMRLKSLSPGKFLRAQRSWSLRRGLKIVSLPGLLITHSSKWVLLKSARLCRNNSINGSTALCWALAAFLVFLSYTQSVGILWRGIRPSQGLYLYTEQHKQNKRTHRHPCLEWDSDPRFWVPSERRQYMPQTTRLPWPAIGNFTFSQIERLSMCLSASICEWCLW